MSGLTGRDILQKPITGPGSVFQQVPWSRLPNELERLVAGRLQPEIGFSGPDLDRLEPASLDAVADRLGAAGMGLTVHAPHNDLNPGALDPLVAEVTADRLRRTLECAGRLGANLVVIHPGYDPWRYGFHEELWLERSRAFWPPLIEQAERLGLRVVLENVFDRTPRPLCALLDELGAPCLGFCLDVGHFQLFSEQSLESWLQALAGHLRHLHLHDNHGERDEHLPIGAGSFDFEGLFALLRSHGLGVTATLENPSLDDALVSRRALDSLF